MWATFVTTKLQVEHQQRTILKRMELTPQKSDTKEEYKVIAALHSIPICIFNILFGPRVKYVKNCVQPLHDDPGIMIKIDWTAAVKCFTLLSVSEKEET